MKKTEKSTFRKTIEGSAVLSGLAAAVLFVLHYFTSAGIFEILAITAVTCFYHFAMRLIVGFIVPHLTAKHKLDQNSTWFRQKPFEKQLYKKLRVKNWKDKMPTYEPDNFSLEENSLQSIVRNTCVSELVHEVIVPLSFVPLLFSLVWGTFAVFLITSVTAAMFDCCFIIMQRYNRPRLVRLLERRKPSCGKA